MPKTTQSAILGGGCFWCLEAVYQELAGIESIASGYAGGHVPNPTYEEVCAKETGHAEVVKLEFDPAQISYREILEVFFAIHDPTTLNRQGNDAGPQYRSIILTDGDEQAKVAAEVIASLEAEHVFHDPIVTQVQPLTTFWPAEWYHQDYYRSHRMQPYCSFVISPKLAKFRKQFASRMKV